MWAKYAYNSGISQANILADIVAILTGTTDKATLSAGCNQANTEIINTYDNAGWTVHDAAAGTNAKVIKAECQGDAAQFKFVEINTDTAGQIFAGLWESFNGTTHVGTNAAYGSKTTGHGQRYATGTVGLMYISASSGRILLYGVSSAGNGISNSAGTATGIFEGGREFTWCDVGQGFTPAAQLRSPGSLYATRHKDATGNVQVGASVSTSMLTGFGVSLGTQAFHVNGPAAASGNHAPISEITGQSIASSAALFPNFTPSGVKCVGIGSALDEFSYDGKTWVILPASLTSGGCHFCVPKG